MRIVAALAQYGLLEKRGGGEYRVSEFGVSIVEPISDEELYHLKQEAALNPTLFREVYDSLLSQGGQLPTQLRSILVRSHGIAANAADSAATTLRETFEFADLPANSLSRTRPSGNTGSQYSHLVDDAKEAVALEPAAMAVSSTMIDQKIAPERQSPMIAQVANEGEGQVFVVTLSGGKRAKLQLPSVITDRDLMILRRQLDVIELQIGES